MILVVLCLGIFWSLSPKTAVSKDSSQIMIEKEVEDSSKYLSLLNLSLRSQQVELSRGRLVS